MDFWNKNRRPSDWESNNETASSAEDDEIDVEQDDGNGASDVDVNADGGSDNDDDDDDDDDDEHVEDNGNPGMKRFKYEKGPEATNFQQKKREHHNNSEKQRRIAIKESFDNLKKCLPSLANVKNASKARILGTSCSYINNMLDKQRKWNHDIELIHRENDVYKKKIEILEKAIKTGVIDEEVMDACKPNFDNLVI